MRGISCKFRKVPTLFSSVTGASFPCTVDFQGRSQSSALGPVLPLHLRNFAFPFPGYFYTAPPPVFLQIQLTPKGSSFPLRCPASFPPLLSNVESGAAEDGVRAARPHFPLFILDPFLSADSMRQTFLVLISRAWDLITPLLFHPLPLPEPATLYLLREAALFPFSNSLIVSLPLGSPYVVRPYFILGATSLPP